MRYAELTVIQRAALKRPESPVVAPGSEGIEHLKCHASTSVSRELTCRGLG